MTTTATLALDLPPEVVERLADAVAERVLARLEGTDGGMDPERWMDTRDAAAYLGTTPNALHKLTSARTVPFEQDGPGAKCWFTRRDLDAWRRDGGRVR